MITQAGVTEFKSLYCDENPLIASLLNSHFSGFFIEPILDVGSGLGDITASAFPDKNVIHLDILDYSDQALPDAHSRTVEDFFGFVPPARLHIGTIFFCHVLQFIDDDLDRLNERVRDLSPSYIVTVTNCNDGYMKDLLSWVETNFAAANPEVELAGFPRGYGLDTQLQFAGTVRCGSHSILADQVIYLMDASPSASERDRLEERLAHDLFSPHLEIKQTIKVYRKT